MRETSPDPMDDLFVREMGKVQPIKQEKKVVAAKVKPVRVGDNMASGRKWAGMIAKPDTALSVQATHDPWVLVADGVSRERLKRLAAGKPSIGTVFDLHGMTRDEALEILESGVEQALLDGLRVVCIIHGRGLHSEGRAVLKDAVYRWLQQGALAHTVLAVIPQPGSGGGACLVLLRRQ